MVYITEDEQIEAIKRWWKENGRFVIAGLAIGVAAVFGWRAWENYKAEQAAAASTQQAELSAALEAGDPEKARSVGAHIVNEYGGTPYAAHAALALAKLEIDANDFDAAREHLQWVLDNADDEPLRLTARLRLAHLLLARNDPQAALQKLGRVEAGGFAALFDEARGDAYKQLGQPDKAREAYASALAALEPGMGDRALLEMKLNELGVGAAVQFSNSSKTTVDE